MEEEVGKGPFCGVFLSEGGEWGGREIVMQGAGGVEEP